MSSGGGNSLDQLEQQLERSIENVRQIRIVVSDFQPQGQTGLNTVTTNIPVISLSSHTWHNSMLIFEKLA